MNKCVDCGTYKRQGVDRFRIGGCGGSNIDFHVLVIELQCLMSSDWALWALGSALLFGQVKERDIVTAPGRQTRGELQVSSGS